jgi:hypothetical protein
MAVCTALVALAASALAAPALCGQDLEGRVVEDSSGNPGADMHVLLLPADARSEGILAARIVQGQTDQTGRYTSPTLAPGNYYAVATEDSYDATVESIGKLWRSRNRFKEVDVAPGGAALVTLEPVKLD